jgi:glycosyltransferase involved in cell wall biosynthesis
MDLTIIVPCRNEVETLNDQLEALHVQVCPADWEVCVVDNGSTDGSQELVRSWAARWPRIRLVEANERGGVGYARNAGVLHSSATHAAFCDGDDIVGPGWVDALWAQLQKTDLATGVLEPSLLNPPLVALSRGGVGLLEPRFMGFPIVAGCNGGFRRDVWESLNGYDEDYDGLEDIDFSLRALAAGFSIGCTELAIVHYRYRTDLKRVWRQGIFYGRSYPRLCKEVRDLGLGDVPRFARWKTWLVPVLRLPWIRSRDGRVAWVWSVANRVGTLRGVVGHRAFWV